LSQTPLGEFTELPDPWLDLRGTTTKGMEGKGGKGKKGEGTQSGFPSSGAYFSLRIYAMHDRLIIAFAFLFWLSGVAFISSLIQPCLFG